jgi:hypothetical protein
MGVTITSCGFPDDGYLSAGIQLAAGQSVSPVPRPGRPECTVIGRPATITPDAIQQRPGLTFCPWRWCLIPARRAGSPGHAPVRPGQVHRRRVDHHARHALLAEDDAQRAVDLTHHQLLGHMRGVRAIGEEVDEQLGNALRLVVMDPVRRLGQALDAVQVGHVVAIGLG